MELIGNKIKCTVTTTIELIGGRWKVPILYYLSNGTRRFGPLNVAMEFLEKYLQNNCNNCKMMG